MEKITTTKARDSFADIISKIAFGKERIILTRNGREIAAIISVEDLENLEEFEDLADLEQARKAIAETGTHVDYQNFRQKHNL